MPISVQVPKDLRKIKPKVIGSFTKRQIICFALAAACGVPLYFLLRKPLGMEIALIIMMVAISPFFLAALYEKNGLPAEKFVFLMIRFKLRKPIRPYMAQNLYLERNELEKKRKEVEKLEEKRRQHKKSKRRNKR